MAGYEELVGRVAHQKRDEITADLARARADVARYSATLKEAQDRVAAYSGLLTMADRFAGGGNVPASHLTLHEAMAEVLRSAPERMMRPGHLAEEIERRGLYRMRDGRAVEKQQVQARVGNYPELFAREGTFIKLQ